MYWPIGAPKIYAARKHHECSKSDQVSHDGLERSQDGPPGAHDEDGEHGGADIIDVKVARGGHLFATPTTLLATVLRSKQSLHTYGTNKSLLLRPDALIVVVQTEKGFLITYSVASDPTARVYQTQVYSTGGSHTRRPSHDGYGRPGLAPEAGPGEGNGIREVNIRFRMVIRIDAGISKALVLDDQLVVTTVKPAAVQCIRWSPDSTGSSHSTELLKRMPWFADKSIIADMVYDRPMNLHTWVTSDGKVYAVQMLSATDADPPAAKSRFRGYCFHSPANAGSHAIKTAINARFSLIAVSCADRTIKIYTAKDYSGNIPPSHELTLPVSSSTSGALTFMNYSPDGYCLFAGFERGWAMWSVYGKPGASTFAADRALSEANSEDWLCGVKHGFWIGAGCEIVLLGSCTQQLHVLEMARSSLTGCYAFPNISRSLLQASTTFMLYKGFDASDVTTISGETSLWQSVQIPQPYLANQWPIRLSVVSPDGRYVAVAGQRGLAHYSVGSGRWKTFDDFGQESNFTVRGGMCWWQHILVAAIETGNSYQIRLYSREKGLEDTHVLHAESLPYPIVCVATTGDDSLLVYTYDNVLLHYLFLSSQKSINLVQVGQIAFHGIIRAPPRVRAISWILPEDQREHGDPSQDVAAATVLFLVDAKLVLLQPSANEMGDLKYDMRVIAHDVEYYTLAREQPAAPFSAISDAPLDATSLGGHIGHSLRDSLWYFDGTAMQIWPEILDVLSCAPSELGRDLPTPVAVPTDFYPLSTIIEKGILTGLEVDMVQRRDVVFSFFRLNSRIHLFIPSLLRHHLAQYDSSAALHLSHSFQKLPYFSHSLEVLLHNVLDEEVDTPPESADLALLPSVLSFLSSFPSYLDIVAGCTLQSMFEESLERGMLKTAGSYLLILHAFDENVFNTEQIATLLERAKDQGDWDLCKELARFLVGIDETGDLLKTVLILAGLRTETNGAPMSGRNGVPSSPGRISSAPARLDRNERRSHVERSQDGGDYFGGHM
ncbi:hypothetical protein MBLNU459_g1432t1 [Dothideomycetes sp. NU459]